MLLSRKMRYKRPDAEEAMPAKLQKQVETRVLACLPRCCLSGRLKVPVFMGKCELGHSEWRELLMAETDCAGASLSGRQGQPRQQGLAGLDVWPRSPRLQPPAAAGPHAALRWQQPGGDCWGRQRVAARGRSPWRSVAAAELGGLRHGGARQTRAHTGAASR
jgi:hypothetical protein